MLPPRIDAARAARVARVAGLYAVTPDLADTEALVRNVGAALAGGATMVQYRNKHADAALRMRQAAALAVLCAEHGALMIVNDDPSLARDVDAAGVHVGDDDASLAQARQIVGPSRLVGVSCYDDLARARAAVAGGADYVAFGSFFPSSTKPAARRADIALLRAGRSLGVPLVAIGGITADNAQMLIDAGAAAVAVIADVFAHDDEARIARAASRVARLFESNARATRTNGRR